jgi:hypothetical protein
MTDLAAFAPIVAENDGFFFERRLWPLLKRTFLSLEIALHTRQGGIRIVEFTGCTCSQRRRRRLKEFSTPRPASGCSSAGRRGVPPRL